jgi:nucleoside-diphosphate-sugar epimerase
MQSVNRFDHDELLRGTPRTGAASNSQKHRWRPRSFPDVPRQLLHTHQGNVPEQAHKEVRTPALGSVLAGSDRPLIVTSGTGMANTVPGKAATEDGATISSDLIPRAASEEAAASVAAEGVNVSVVRLPQVHDTVRQGLVTYAIATFREKGVCAYVGDGHNRWPAAHVLDVARLYRLALEKAEPGAKYHAVAEEGVSMRDIAEAIGRRLKLPVKSIVAEEAPAFFGWLAMFATHDLPALSEQTQKKLGWRPTGRSLLTDLEHLHISDH